MEESIGENTNMSKNDNRILELKKQVDEKRKKILSNKTKFVPSTNCILELEGNKYNLNVLTEDQLKVLLIRLNTYRLSVDDLQMEPFSISGYLLAEWMNDVRNKLNEKLIRKEEMNLKSMEETLDKLLSEDKKTELELDSIAEMIK